MVLTIARKDLRPGMRLRVISGNWMGDAAIGRIYVVSDPLRTLSGSQYGDSDTSYYVVAYREDVVEGNGDYTIDQFEIAEQFEEPEPLSLEEVKQLWY